MSEEQFEKMDPSTLKELKKYTKYERKIINNHYLEKCLYEINLNIIQAMIIKKKLERKIIALRLKRIFIFALISVLTVVLAFLM